MYQNAFSSIFHKSSFAPFHCLRSHHFTQAITPLFTRTTMTTTPTTAAKFKIALCQMPITTSKDKNIDTAKSYIATSATKGAKLIILPECFNAPYSTSTFHEYAESITSTTSSRTISEMSTLAKEYGVHIVCGSIPEIDEATKKMYNTSITLSPAGQIIAKHRKAHLFDIAIPNKITFKESSVLSSGNTPTTFKIDEYDVIVGVSICYDIRFPELSAIQVRDYGACLLVIPGAFNMTTGPAHWELLIRARALDNQVYVAACSPARNDTNDGSYVAWGHSMIVDPWGKVIEQTDHQPSIIISEIDMDKVNEVRMNIPTSKQRRNDIYQLNHIKS